MQKNGLLNHFLFPVIFPRGKYTISLLNRHGLSYLGSVGVCLFVFNYLLMLQILSSIFFCDLWCALVDTCFTVLLIPSVAACMVLSGLIILKAQAKLQEWSYLEEKKKNQFTDFFLVLSTLGDIPNCNLFGISMYKVMSQWTWWLWDLAFEVQVYSGRNAGAGRRWGVQECWSRAGPLLVCYLLLSGAN